MEKQIKAMQYKCNHCKYEWISNLTKLPKQCPNCKRQDWNRSKNGKH